ncbi:hypothetical protein CK203_059290 [Vitis vinifera]|uniref:DUF4283 domain-containing protein n=1 Tax=Vitis vinifera TaxID=29760 RepID=A0A438FSQ5_VITVI|nr:hypothetical protein CK203_059290 [Vitis vinifera]
MLALNYLLMVFKIDLVAKNHLDGERGGSCWFAIGSKSFEISVDVLGKKLKGIIVERSRGFTLWIRFGSSNLCWLLEGVEVTVGGVWARFVKSWEDGGWALLADKLRSLGISTRDELGKFLNPLRLRVEMGFEGEGEERKILCSCGEYKRSFKSEKAKGSSMATTWRRRRVKRKGVAGPMPCWEMGRSFGFSSTPV